MIIRSKTQAQRFMAIEDKWKCYLYSFYGWKNGDINIELLKEKGKDLLDEITNDLNIHIEDCEIQDKLRDWIRIIEVKDDMCLFICKCERADVRKWSEVKELEVTCCKKCRDDFFYDSNWGKYE